MKKYNSLKIKVLSFGVFALSALFSVANAQTEKSNNEIATVELSNNDGFNQLRNLIVTHFDFTNPEMQQGLVNSELSFVLSEQGKITHVNAKSDCKFVKKELETVLSQLHYKVKMEDLKSDPNLTVFRMPVQVLIANR
ncbi:hypothetical protein [Chryseobacterium sp. A301]